VCNIFYGLIYLLLRTLSGVVKYIKGVVVVVDVLVGKGIHASRIEGDEQYGCQWYIGVEAFVEESDVNRDMHTMVNKVIDKRVVLKYEVQSAIFIKVVGVL
jgi:hypothetical protein